MLNFHLSNLFFPLPLGAGIFSDICWLKSAQKGEIVFVFLRLACMELLLFLPYVPDLSSLWNVNFKNEQNKLCLFIIHKNWQQGSF